MKVYTAFTSDPNVICCLSPLLRLSMYFYHWKIRGNPEVISLQTIVMKKTPRDIIIIQYTTIVMKKSECLFYIKNGPVGRTGRTDLF